MALRSAHKSLKRGSLSVVARDGIEPPTPAFSGPPTDPVKWFGISGSDGCKTAWELLGLGWCRTIWADSAPAMFAYCSHGQFPKPAVFRDIATHL
jgi:hypothetical protein